MQVVFVCQSVSILTFLSRSIRISYPEDGMMDYRQKEYMWWTFILSLIIFLHYTVLLLCGWMKKWVLEINGIDTQLIAFRSQSDKGFQRHLLYHSYQIIDDVL